MPEIINGKRKVWNPISRYYVEPFGEYIAVLLKNTFVTPNMVTIFNLIISALSGYLIFLGGPWLVLFAIMVQFQHALDITDGHLARIKDMRTKFGQLLDYVSDRLIKNIWGLIIVTVLFLETNRLIYLFLGLFFILGRYMHHYVMLSTEKIYLNKEDKVKEGFKNNILSRFVLFFIDIDVQLHVLSFFALINRLDIYLWFYTFYYNFMWLLYMAYYWYRHIRLDGVVQ